MASEILMIPEERKAVLIGKNGKTRKDIEEKTKTKISVDDCIEIRGESFDVLKTRDIVNAIGRGFSPKKAMRLLNKDCRLEIITLEGETENTIIRLRGRVIGRKGAARKKIEHITETYISIYGKTISIIGTWNQIEKAREIVKLLLEGKKHVQAFAALND